MSILVRVCIWYLGIHKLEALEVLMDFLEFFSLDCGSKLLCSCLHVLNTVVELHAMDE